MNAYSPIMKAVFTIFIGFLTTVALAQEGKLDSVRTEVRNPRSDPPSQPSSEPPKDTSKTYSIGSDDPDFNTAMGVLGLYAAATVVATPFALPAGALGDHYQFPSTFVSYPYAEHWNGLMQIGLERNKIDDVVPSTWEHLMSLRAGVEDGNNFNGLNRLGIAYLADTMTRFGIGGSVNIYEENKPQQTPDRLIIADINLLYRFAQSERTQFHAGIGTRFLSDRAQTDWGVNFVYGFDYFPKEPLSIGAQVETGNLGHAWVFRATGRIGLVWKYSEIYTGYDYLHIGSNVLQGPMVGLRIWF